MSRRIIKYAMTSVGALVHQQAPALESAVRVAQTACSRGSLRASRTDIRGIGGLLIVTG